MPSLPASQPASIEQKKKAFRQVLVFNLIIFLLLVIACAIFAALTSYHTTVFFVLMMLVTAFMFYLNLILGIIALIRRNIALFEVYRTCALIIPFIGLVILFTWAFFFTSLETLPYQSDTIYMGSYYY
ncbi:MAG: hypothetical protein WCP97_03970 [bacterium]